MTKAQKKIRLEMVKWGSVGLSAGILSQDTGYAFSTCKKEIEKVVSEGWTEIWYGNRIELKSIENFRNSIQ